MGDKIKGGLADGKSLTDIANMHKVDINDLTKEYQKGIKVEMEHTSDKKIAEEIAKDHLFENPKYYTKLATVEETLKINIKSLLKEDIESIIVDESPDTIQILVKYNGRNAGVISVTPANVKDTMEIVGVKFKEDYHTLFILDRAVKSLWQVLSGTKAIIVAPKPEGIESWNKLGFQRISKNYLIKNRGH